MSQNFIIHIEEFNASTKTSSSLFKRAFNSSIRLFAGCICSFSSEFMGCSIHVRNLFYTLVTLLGFTPY